jgi:hypothetical protein
MAFIMQQPPVTLREYPSGTTVIIELGLDCEAARIALCRGSAPTTQVICTLTSIDVTLQSMKIASKDVVIWSIGVDTIPILSNALNKCWLEVSQRSHRIAEIERGFMSEQEEDIEFELCRVDEVDGNALSFIDRIKLSISPTNILFMEGALNRVFFLKSAMSELGHTIGNYRVCN